jgi:hypothetical protein
MIGRKMKKKGKEYFIKKNSYVKDIHGKEEDCIMLQLQRLFARLQMKFTNVVDTKDLTKSFQWNAGESFEQQDIQVKKINIKKRQFFFLGILPSSF